MAVDELEKLKFGAKKWMYVFFAIAILPFIAFGFTAVIGFYRIITSPVTTGSVPVWAIFIVGIIILIVMRRSKRY